VKNTCFMSHIDYTLCKVQQQKKLTKLLSDLQRICYAVMQYPLDTVFSRLSVHTTVFIIQIFIYALHLMSFG